MEEEIPKNYDPQTSDPKWEKFWEENSFFRADPTSKKPPYCIVIPPPNVTGALHMGHALVNTLQDILIRWKRMSGYEALWVPGTDHAGISTQTIVERHLMKTQGKKRTDYKREEFLDYVWNWKDEYEKRIIGQLKKIGASCDWSRTRFTMDERNNRAVRKIFKKLYEKGLIYRGDYLVNWDPVTQTALADDEVEYEERESFLWHIRYRVVGSEETIIIATTRPETMLGDTAVAVHPSDPRFTSLVGKKVVLPLTGREIPIIADHRVDPEFGTGCVKITPAHDPNDYAMGLDHRLPFLNIMTPDGKINDSFPPYSGLPMEEARAKVARDLKEKGFLVKTVPHTNRVGVSYRSKAIIEPYMSKQWFVKMGEFGKRLEEAVREGKTNFIPKAWENVYFHWIKNLRDWCISRQLWWGHQIPIWYRKDNPEEMVCLDGEELPPGEWVQDEDVLDTWFSSALWPFAALGWPEETPELKKFYPNSVLVTGHDILFFWVARMILMGEFAREKVPFPEVFLHGLIFAKSYWRKNPAGGITYVSAEERKEYELGKTPPKEVEFRWEKMSKSKGNIIDPLEIIDEYGTDAMRMALTASATQAREIDLDRRRFDEFKNFANKVWNGARFVLMNIEDLSPEAFGAGLDLGGLKLEDKWILSKLNHVIQNVTSHLERYQFDQSALEAYDFFWKEFCAYYVEICKPVLFKKMGTPEERTNKQRLLLVVLLASIRLLHPMAPFITEELFSLVQKKFPALKGTGDPYTLDAVDALAAQGACVAPYPKVHKTDIDEKIEKAFAFVEEAVYTIRNIRGEMQIPPGMAVDVFVIGQDTVTLEENRGMIEALVKIGTLRFAEKEPSLPFHSTGVLGDLKIVIPLPQEMIAKEKVRLEKEQEKVLKQLERVEEQLANQEFISRAPNELVEKQRQILKKHQTDLTEIKEKIAKL